MTGILKRGNGTQTCIWRCHVKFGATLPPNYQKLGEGLEQILPLVPLEQGRPCQHHDLGPLASKTVREKKKSVVHALQFVVFY